MNLTDIYNDGNIFQKRQGTTNDPFVPVSETLQIINGKVQLREVPARFNKVTVSGQSVTWVEVENTTLSDNTFTVDYVYGNVFFHPVNEGKTVNFSYTGTGSWAISSQRVWTKQSNNQVTETLQNVIDNTTTAVNNYNGMVTTVNNKIADTETARQNAITATNNANTATTNANTAATNALTTTSNYDTVVTSTKKIYQPMVATYVNIATTYPIPQIGWTVVAQDNHIEYRWDGTGWIDVGISDVFDGFNVVVSATAPNNVNAIWLNASVATYGSRIKASPSTIPPATNQIWWTTDN